MGVTLRKLVGHLVDWTCKCELPLVAGHLDQIAHGLVVEHGYWTVRVSIDDGDAGSGSGEGLDEDEGGCGLPCSALWVRERDDRRDASEGVGATCCYTTPM